MPNISTLIIIFGVLLISSSAIGGTILLMGIGLGAPGGGGPPPPCTNSLDFSQACNSQYISVAL
jgi:hypothetical protein